MAETLRRSRAVKIYICNVMTQPGETDGYTASMHVKAIMEHVGKGVIDYVLVHSGKISDAMRESYAAQGSFPVEVDRDALNRLGVGFVQADIMSGSDAGHHDPVKLREAVMKMVYGLTS
jgi:uncharacterized cofD-like protein